VADKTLELIRAKEGYSSTAYYDKNAWRIGYGSDTMTNEDGTVVAVTKSSITSKAAAERDLQRRVPEFQNDGVIKYVGQEAWDAMTDEAKAAVTSLAYNYGSLNGLPSLVKAIKSGDNNAIGNAIGDRAVDNDGQNSARRKEEAALVLGHPSVPAGMVSDQATAVGSALSTKRPDPAPVPMPRSAASDARKAAALAAAGGVPTPKAPVQGLTLPHAPVAAPLAPSMSPADYEQGSKGAAPLKQIVPGGNTNPQAQGSDVYKAIQAMPTGGAARPPGVAPATAKPKALTLRDAMGTSTPAPGAIRTGQGVAAVTPMAPGARPASIPLPDSAPISPVKTPVMAPLAKPAPLSLSAGQPSWTKPVYKNVQVLNPAYTGPLSGGLSPDARDEANAGKSKLMAGAAATGGVAKFITKRVLVTPAKKIAAPATPAARGGTVLAPKPSTALVRTGGYVFTRGNNGSLVPTPASAKAMARDRLTSGNPGQTHEESQARFETTAISRANANR
jgi:GH24 family phage-related lysozyme (muramidase)